MVDLSERVETWLEKRGNKDHIPPEEVEAFLDECDPEKKQVRRFFALMRRHGFLSYSKPSKDPLRRFSTGFKKPKRAQRHQRQKQEISDHLADRLHEVRTLLPRPDVAPSITNEVLGRYLEVVRDWVRACVPHQLARKFAQNVLEDIEEEQAIESVEEEV